MKITTLIALAVIAVTWAAFASVSAQEEAIAVPSNNAAMSDSNSASDAASNSQSAANNAINSATQITAVSYGDLPGLYRLPQAVCQGPSGTAGAAVNDGLFGLGLSLGGSEVDKQCTLRANILLLSGISGDPNLMFMMISQLEGLERLWDIDQDEDCREWLIENDDEADEHGCVWPEFVIVDKY